ncbi:hypothetical protein [Mucilaginibacter antarcticus]|uniref:hypothetical protein n=1 Tax=Mucilaginibacter antarcticus TaxID=1855725 RepID=UPI0036313AA5
MLAFYTYFPYAPGGGWEWKFGVGLGIVDEETGVIKTQISLRHLGRRTHEKNWSPYIVEGEIFMITDYDPFIRVIKIGNMTGAFNTHEVYVSFLKTKGWKYGELRGYAIATKTKLTRRLFLRICSFLSSQ